MHRLIVRWFLMHSDRLAARSRPIAACAVRYRRDPVRAAFDRESG